MLFLVKTLFHFFFVFFFCAAKISTASIDCPTEHLIEGKTSVNLTCDADGLVTNRIWLKDGKAVVPGDRFSFHRGNRVLSISPTHRTDTGEIICNVSNDVSFQTAMCSLKVYCKYGERHYNIYI